MSDDQQNTVTLDGESLTIEGLMSLDNPSVGVRLSPEAKTRILDGRKVVEEILTGEKLVYGINTGFGLFSNVAIPKEDLNLLQVNLIRSHSAGVGEPLTPARVRRLLALRINVLAKGRSGIRLETVETLINACNLWCLPFVPQRGTVGASGDLAPLAHLALGMIGEGRMWDPKRKVWGEAEEILRENGIEPISLTAKEGLAMINGTQLITSIGAEAVHRAINITTAADVASAMTLESLRGTTKAFDPSIHLARPHRGQKECAERMRQLLHSKENPSEIYQSHQYCGMVQDSYTLRCIPQVHGISIDTIEFVKGIIETEMNSATDNPMVFSERNEIISGGNFHGEYPAKALDYLAIAVHEYANISEVRGEREEECDQEQRRIERLVNPALSGLPAFLVKEGGLNSGFMIAHCTAAALVSENKVLCHPSSIDSISTSAAKEDHVSMGGWSARKALQVVEHVEYVLSIEMLAACQAIDFLRPLKTTRPLEAVYGTIRAVVPTYEMDRFMQPDIEKTRELLQKGHIVGAVREYLH
ncbi:hypothetical protein PROFUN_06725 [Planoprotostelium fungivorum]|uniref:Histidine ammonia-lyase n=1 Tax=Planoprotostelium fungivorum TaxID=1890364 RepID=A0A2P6NG62_9EUKA|nr:hypothetical protein PROFUN_06725 [Planoprotostelium fungivorum]